MDGTCIVPFPREQQWNMAELVKKSRQTDDKQSFPFIPLFGSAGKQHAPPTFWLKDQALSQTHANK